jgi:histidyl-tRNA synthetase
MFRYERPQKGRMRQFHQINCECLGAKEPHADAEVITMLMQFLTRLGIKDLTVSLNSLGCKECRPSYREALHAFLQTLDKKQLCGDCLRRMDSNPMRVLDCKIHECQALLENAPKVMDYNCENCRQHIATVERLLKASRVNYIMNPRLVRGLDYYNRTTFEVLSGSIGAQSAVTGGGRYDGLIRSLGGPDIPGIGFACGMERLAMLLPERAATRTDFYLAPLSAQALDAALILAEELRVNGFSGHVAFAAKSLKSQLRQAGKLMARKCILLGEDELAAQTALIKDMDSGGQEAVPLAELINALRRMIPAEQKD